MGEIDKMGRALSEMWERVSRETRELHESQRSPALRSCAVLQNRAGSKFSSCSMILLCRSAGSVRRARGTGGHNGLDSIIVQFGTEEIPRLRIGIGAAPREGSVDYVLESIFRGGKAIVRSTIDRAAETLKCAIDKGVVSAMNTFQPESLRGEQIRRNMKSHYEALLVLNTQAKEDNVKEIIDRLESEFKKEGAEIEQVQKMDKRQFSYMAGALDSGYYVNFIFHADPQSIARLRIEIQTRSGRLPAALPAAPRREEGENGRKKGGKSRSEFG